MDRRTFSTTSLGMGAIALSACARHSCATAEEPRYRVAVIGHTGRGDYGHGLDTVWASIDRTQLVAVADANSAGLRKAVQKLGLDDSAGFADYRKMLQVERPDVVAVCPRHVDQHHDMILAAIEAGAKGVYVEKPFVRTPEEADDVLAACRKHSANVAVAHRNRYHPTLQRIAELVEQGRIGRLLEIRGRGKGDRRGGGEDLWVLGSHVLNMIHFLGGKPRRVSGVLMQDGRRVTRSDVRQGAEGLGPLAGNELHARFELESGLIAYFESIANDGTKNHGFGLQLIGSEGIISIRADRTPLAHLVPGNPFEPTDTPRPWLPITSAGVDTQEPNPQLLKDVYRHVVSANDLIDAVAEGRRPLCDAETAALTVEMICGVFQSHCQGSQSIPIPLVQRRHPLSQW